MNYIRQIIFELRHQTLMTWLSIAGTTIAVFLIMSDFMVSRINIVSAAPESRRERILYGFGGEVVSYGGKNRSSSSISLELAHELYEGLDGVELVAYTDNYAETIAIGIDGGKSVSSALRKVDDNFWKIYDYTFEQGVPFTREEVEAGVNNIILSHSTAETHFGKDADILGRSLRVGNREYRVSGVVSDVNPLMSLTCADAFVPHTSTGMPSNVWNYYLGDYQAILLLNPGTDPASIQQQTEGRYNAFNDRHKNDDLSLTYHGQPYDTEIMNSGVGTNDTPDLSDKRRMRYIGYAILLLIPAINLSSMTRSRMRRRVSEIGLRRAFGCTRFRLLSDLLTENFILTLLGGVLGLGLSIVFITTFSNYFVAYGNIYGMTLAQTMARPSLSMLFSWQIFFVVLGFCFLLNLLSAGIPALKAAFTNPAEALSGENAHK